MYASWSGVYLRLINRADVTPLRNLREVLRPLPPPDGPVIFFFLCEGFGWGSRAGGPQGLLQPNGSVWRSRRFGRRGGELRRFESEETYVEPVYIAYTGIRAAIGVGPSLAPGHPGAAVFRGLWLALASPDLTPPYATLRHRVGRHRVEPSARTVSGLFFFFRVRLKWRDNSEMMGL